MQCGQNPLQIEPSPSPNTSESQFSCRFQELINRCKYAYVRLKHALEKSSCISKIPPGVLKKLRITDSVSLSTLKQTALLL